jgi:hypothetical protein
LSPLDELSELLTGSARVVVIAQRDVNLRTLAGENSIFLLEITEGSGAAGGRSGGFGQRSVAVVKLFHYANGVCEKLFETDDEARLSGFEIPYHVARMPFTLSDGTERMGYGVIEPDLVAEFLAKTK